MDEFVHLEVHSAFSFLWGAFTPEDLVREASALGQRAVALTDYGLHGAVMFSKAAAAAGIQPILGVKISIWDGSLIVLLATDSESYGNLCRLVSITLGNAMAPQAPITRQDLKHWSKRLICLAGGRKSRIRSWLSKGRKDSARVCLLEIREVLHDPNRLYLMLQNHAPDREDRSFSLMDETAALAEELNVPPVATNEVTFLKSEDYTVHHIMAGIQRKRHHRDIEPVPNETFFLTSGEEMRRRIPYPAAIDATREVARLCSGFSLPIGELHPPSIQKPREAARKLTALSLKELSRLHSPVPVNYLRRLDHELRVIEQLELSDYFLLVRDVVDFARGRGIRHSVRGSAAGSLVGYLLLGGVDPVEYDLLFERFINEGRGDMPDIDVDFDSEQRDDVIHYLLELFPRQTAMVSTIHSFKVRSAVRLAARALGYSLGEIRRLSQCLPWSLRGRDLMNALETLPELRNTPLQKETELVRAAARLTGLPFQCSVHLGGVIITPGDVRAWTPVGRSPKGLPVGQLDKDDTEALGLLKLDLLGLRMHTAVAKALKILEKTGALLDLERLPLDDRRTYALLRSTESVGVFQVESPGQRNLLAWLQPRRFSDLIAEISLFRPGPVEGNMVQVYVRRRHGTEPVQIPHPDLVPVLEETYGVILFQEQVLRIVHIFAGLSYANADAFRRAMTKDRRSGRMEQLQQRFVEGALSKGHSRKLIDEVFEKVSAFAAYGFCKAHAASFAHITYQSAYLKAHHPQAFYLGLLNAGHVGSYPAHVILSEARRRGIPVYCPHVNASGLDYEAEGAGIRVPLVVINGVGAATARRIVAERKRRGLFQGERDFLARLSLPDRIVDTMLLAGALKGLEEHEWELIPEVCSV